MARYKEQKDKGGTLIGILINDTTHGDLPQGSTIPIAVGNRHYDEYLLLVAEPNTVDAADVYDHEPDMRSDLDARIHATDDTIMRDVRQKRQGMDDAARTSSPDAINDAELIVLDTYIKDLADLPGLITAQGEIGAAGSFETPTWPSKPSFIP